MDLQVTLDSASDAPSRARMEIDALADLLEPDVLADLRLVVSELVTNAYLHGPRAPIELRIAVNGPAHVKGEVSDRGNGTVAIRDSDPSTIGGWGLRLVDLLTRRWGVGDGSTRVWFELAR